jgi:endogenous inhibitor of DNA gyrase (YacG/DUF329 family)
MRPLSAVQLLDAWEQGLSEPAYRRTLPLLVAASFDSRTDAAALSIGARDRSLLALRERTFGSQLASVVNCPACGERLEWTASAADLYVSQKPEQVDALWLEEESYSVNFRVPNTSDLAVLANCADMAAAHDALLNRCVLSARVDGEETKSSELPDEIVAAIVKRMAEDDPQADLKFALSCPACGNNWEALFDIESFFWSEINAWARRILMEVHLLASAYGWTETDILKLSPRRRQFYLGLASV